MIRRAIPATPRDLAGDSEERLIERSLAGDMAAFSEIVTAYQRRVRAYVGGLILQPDIVDDLAQEVFLAALRALPSYSPDRPLGPWLLGIARNKVLMYLRSEGRRRSRQAGAVEATLGPYLIALVAAEEEELARRERELEALQRCLASLPAPSARVIQDRYFRARSIPDIARALGRREGAVRMTLLRLRAALRACVQSRVPQEEA
jgi:RNA polymerase sigma-70 factor (ECF subfamily)